MQTKRIVCLANSRKLVGRYIAGREWDGSKAGPWIRPVSRREGQDVSEYERQYEDGSDPRPLDVIDVPVIEHTGPEAASWQNENWLLDEERYWRKLGRISWFSLPALVDDEQPLWSDGSHTQHGKNDRVPFSGLTPLEGSLRLIEVEELALAVFAPTEAFGNRKRRVQGRFHHAGRAYALWVMDPVCERRHLAKLDGHYRLGRCFLTISLGEPFDGYCYKLIAAVIEDI